MQSKADLEKFRKRAAAKRNATRQQIQQNKASGPLRFRDLEMGFLYKVSDLKENKIGNYKNEFSAIFRDTREDMPPNPREFYLPSTVDLKELAR